ncbi:MAG: threonine/serine dehydratase [Pseudomonadota bacterium]
MNIEMIRAAAKRLSGQVRRTPLLNAPLLDEVAGRKIWVKPECLQYTGSFKYRGAYSALSALSADKRTKGVIAYSSGNHAQGVARAAAQFGAPALIVMPADAPRMKIDNTRALGAEVVLYDRVNGEDRDAIGQKIARERELTMIRPFDEPQVIAGQGTAGLEIAQQARDAGVSASEVLVCCGGGGFIAGIALALAEEAPHLRVRPVEPERFDDMTRSLHSGARECNAQTTGSICDAIISPMPGEITFPILQKHVGSGLVVTDNEALHAMALAFTHLKLVAEPGGAVALAAALFHSDAVSGDDVIVTISGGNVDAHVFQTALQKFGSH